MKKMRYALRLRKIYMQQLVSLTPRPSDENERPNTVEGPCLKEKTLSTHTTESSSVDRSHRFLPGNLHPFFLS
jgi:hypothetical protein